MTQLTTLDELSQLIILLASVEESDAPFISCYLNLEDGADSWRKIPGQRSRIFMHILTGNDLVDFENVVRKIENWLSPDLHPDAKGVAIFVRGSFGSTFMLPMQFASPLPTWITVCPTTNIYHLVELKDKYHCYVVVGSEWSRFHYQVHQTHRGDQFLCERLAVQEQLMSAGGSSHLILAGNLKTTQRIRHTLPDHLTEKTVNVIPASERDQNADVVMATLSSFIEHEEQESQTIAERLIEGLRHQNLAVVGSKNTLDALLWGEVDTLIMASNYKPDPGWTCSHCKAVDTEFPDASICTHCDHPNVRPTDIRETLLRLASQQNCPVEVVEQSDALISLGGVGCLLRTQLTLRGESQTAHEVTRNATG